MEVFDIKQARANSESYKVELKDLIDKTNLWIEETSKVGKTYVHFGLDTKSEEMLNSVRKLFEEAGYRMEFTPSKNWTDVKVSW